MAVVTVEMWEGRTVEQKRRLVAAITQAMVDHAGASPHNLHVIIHEIPRHNWGRAGVLGSELEGGAVAGAPGPDRLSHVLLQVGDLAAAERFFVEVLGFAVRDRGVLRDGRPLVVLREGLGLTPRPADAHASAGSVDHIAFRVWDLGAMRARLDQAGIAYEGPLTTTAYGNSIYVPDPDGTRIELHDRWREGSSA